MAKKEKPKVKRSAAEQAAIDKRMAGMRAARDAKKLSNAQTVKPAPTKATAPAQAAFIKPTADLGKSASSVAPAIAIAVAGDVPKASAPSTEPQGGPQIKRWTFTKLEDFAVLSRDQIVKALHMTAVCIQKAHHYGRAVESVTYTEQGRIVANEVELEVDPLA